ncbi:DUF2794 domain-containing protein [Sneathiella sp. P13V-1]|uniref:DUF2794 domain-containing protein n=1 Tax=Sneathiella sp. P13V-1 TaxID=2697366 RepID=UPI00187BBF11|nr:DUF2794 domain-containing protein [Sneathiella sp. P13V-1]MBE7636450.1 DUF2794 domain-containing protein [Sneathiella sp. P13V-1]
MSDIIQLNQYQPHDAGRSINGSRTPAPVFFNRRELGMILQVYGRMVAKSEWRDYAIGQTKTTCSFAVFHRTTEKPLYKIFKEPKLANKQGAFSIEGQNGRILKRGKTLEQVLRLFDKKRFETVD